MNQWGLVVAIVAVLLLTLLAAAGCVHLPAN